MRITYLTPGAGAFYCGSCMRDNTLARAIQTAGHEIQLIPLYLPVTTDEESLSRNTPVFFGGINVYLQEKLPLFRRIPAAADRLLDAAPFLRVAARFAGMTDPHGLGPMTYSMLCGEDGHQAKELHRLIEWLVTQPKPDIVCLSNVLLSGCAPLLKEALGAPVICTLQGEDTFVDSFTPEWRQRCWELLGKHAKELDGLIAVSRYYGDLMSEKLQLNGGRLRIVPNGIDEDGFGPAEHEPPEPTIGYLARMCPSKGLDTLVDAFLLLKQKGHIPNLKLLVAGTTIGPDHAFVRRQKAKLSRAGHARDASFHPDVSRTEKQRLLRGMTVFSVPATYGESFGLYAIEAMACGLPLVLPRHAAFPELIRATEAGTLVEPGNVGALAEGLEQVLLNPEARAKMSRAGLDASRRLYTAERMAEGVLDCFQEVIQGSHD